MGPSSVAMDPRQGSSDLLYFGLNQDYGCFSCGTTTGFRVYNCEPFRETVSSSCYALHMGGFESMES